MMNQRPSTACQQLLHLHGFAAALLCAGSMLLPWRPATAETAPRTVAPRTVAMRTSACGDPVLRRLVLREGVERGADGGNEPDNVPGQNDSARAVSIAAGDLDGDGVPDLVVGAIRPGGGVLTLYPGNIESIWPEHRQGGTMTAGPAPFLAAKRVVDLPFTPDFLAVGDFDADGRADVLACARAGDALYLLRVHADGQIGPSERIDLPGAVTSFVTGEMDRADGYPDVAVGIVGPEGPRALIFESPRGAFAGEPQILPLPAPATSLALGPLDRDARGLAVAAGRTVLVVHGRDEQRSLREVDRPARAPRVDRVLLPSRIKSLALGTFVADGRDHVDLAVLSADGVVRILHKTERDAARPARKRQGVWRVLEERRLADALVRRVASFPEAASRFTLASARISGGPGDDLLLLDMEDHSLHALGAGSALEARTPAEASLALEGEPLAVLPMRLNPDALDDLLILSSGSNRPVVAITVPDYTFVVNSDGDDPDASPGDAHCSTANPNYAECTLLAAVQEADALGGSSVEIDFNIPGPGPHVIHRAGSLGISNPKGVVVDGYTQPGASPNSNPITAGSNAVLQVELDGSAAPIDNHGFYVSGGNSVIRGLAIHGYRGNSSNDGGNAIELTKPANDPDIGRNIVEGNFLGTDVSGTSGRNDGCGVFVLYSSYNTIGGTTLPARNLLSGDLRGVELAAVFGFGTTSHNVVSGNLIGTDKSGGSALYNLTEGIFVSLDGEDNVIGGPTISERNVISGNRYAGIRTRGANQTLVQGNFIGTDVSGTLPVPNGQLGLYVSGSHDIAIGGPKAGEACTPPCNLISGNGSYGGITLENARNVTIEGNVVGAQADGVSPLGNHGLGVYLTGTTHDNMLGGTGVTPGACDGPCNRIAFNDYGLQQDDSTGVANAIQGNSIFDNGGLGINLCPSGCDGVTLNDSCDTDVAPGGNTLQNFPALSAAVPSASSLGVSGTLDSAANTSFRLEFFASTVCNGSTSGAGEADPYGEGETFLGGATVTTGACGATPFTVTLPLPSPLPPGRWITATALDPAGNTSEFSRCVRACPGAGTIPFPYFMAKQGNDLVLSWLPSCAPGDSDYEVYEGTIFYNHAPVVCTTSGATSATIPMGPGFSYYLVVPRNACVEGSYGKDWLGVERPQGAPACNARDIACP